MIVARPRDQDDHITWLLEHDEYEVLHSLFILYHYMSPVLAQIRSLYNQLVVVFDQ